MANKKKSEPNRLSVGRLANLVKESSENGQRFCFILGSGASASSGIPTGKELEMRWMNCLMGVADDGSSSKMNPKDSEAAALKLLNDKKIGTSFADLRKAWEEARTPGGKSISSQYYFDIYKLRFYPEPRNGFKYLAEIMESCEPSVGYHPLARMLAEADGIDLVITTNFDSLTEDALFIYTDERPIVVGHESLVEYIELDNRQRPIVAKVHRGLFYEPKNDKESTSKLSKGWKDALDYIFSQYTPIVIGYAGGDRSLMSYLESPRTRIKGGVYWCHMKGDIPDARIQKLVSDKGGCFVEIDGFDDTMLTIGQMFFGESLIPTHTKELLDERARKRHNSYDHQWTNWAIEDESMHSDAITKLIKAETEEEHKRDNNSSLTIEDRFRRAIRANNESRSQDAILEATELIDSGYQSYMGYFIRGVHHCNVGEYNNAIEDLTKAIRPGADYNPNAYVSRARAYYNLDMYDEAINDLSEALCLDPKDALAYKIRGDVNGALRRFDKAIEDFSTALQKESEDPISYWGRGQAYYLLKDYDKAIEDLSEALRLYPELTEAYKLRGNAYSLLEQYDKAKADFSEALQIGPEDSVIYRGRGLAYYYLKEYGDSVNDFTEALRLSPDDAIAYLLRGIVYGDLGQYDKAIDDFSKALQIASDDPDILSSRGQAYIMIGEYNKAIEDFSEALRLNPEKSNVYKLRGATYCSLDQYDKAIEDYSKSLQIKSDDSEVYCKRGFAYMQIEEYDKAIEDFSEALRINPHNFLAYRARGDTYVLLQELDKAIDDFSTALRIDSKSAAAYLGRAQAYFFLDEYDKAIKDLSKAIQLDPDDVSAYKLRGAAYFSLEQYSEGINDLSVVLGYEPLNVQYYMSRGSAYDSIQQYNKAIEDYSNAIKLKSDNAGGFINRSFAYYKWGKYPEAKADAEKAIELDPENAYAYCNRGIARDKLGEHEEAVKDLTRCLELLPEDELPNQALGRRYRAAAYRAMGMEKEALKDESDAETIEKSVA